jgi:hypothetical protein
MNNQQTALRLALEALEYWDVHGKLHQPTEEAITAIKQVLEQPAKNASKQFHEWAVAEHAALVQPVAMRMPKVGDRVVCIEDESLGTVVYLTAGGSPEIKFDDGSHGTYMVREFAELFGYTTLPAAQEIVCSTGLCHYKPAAPVRPLPFGVGGSLVAIKTLLSRDPCVHANIAIEMIDVILKEHPAAQPAPDLQAELEATNRQVEILSDALAESRREVAALKSVQEPVAKDSRDCPYCYHTGSVHCGDVKDKILSNGGDLGYCSNAQIYGRRTQPAPVQPVAWMYELIIDGEVCNVECTNVNWNPEYQPFGRAGIDFVEGGKVTKTPLYTTPPAAQRQWVGLTDEERTKIRREHYARTLPLMEAVEAKLHEKNT